MNAAQRTLATSHKSLRTTTTLALNARALHDEYGTGDDCTRLVLQMLTRLSWDVGDALAERVPSERVSTNSRPFRAQDEYLIFVHSSLAPSTATRAVRELIASVTTRDVAVQSHSHANRPTRTH